MRRSHRSSLTVALTGLALVPAFLTGCAGTDTSPAPEDPVVIDDAGGQGNDGADPSVTPATDEASTEASAEAAAEATPAPAAPEKVAPTVFAAEGDYFPGPLSTVRFAGLRYLDASQSTSIHIVQTSAEKEGNRVPFAQKVTDGERALEESFVAEVTSRGLHVGLADGRLRSVPAPVREMPRRPRVGETWSVALGGSAALCRVESIDTAQTFVGAVEGCVRVTIEHPGGAVHQRWYHPEQGLVRAEARSASGHLLSGWALSNEAWPTMDQVRRVFPRDG